MDNLEQETKEQSTPAYYSILPAKVRYDKRLDMGAILLYSEITALSNAKGYCYATNKYFANLYDVSIGTISRWIKELSEYGYVTITLVYVPGTKEIDYRKIVLRDMEGVPTLVQTNIEAKTTPRRFEL